MPTPIPPSDHTISLDEALEMVRRYRESKPTERPTPTLIFHRKAYDRILGQPGCVGIRAYPALRDDDRETVVLVGVDEKGSDMLGELAEIAVECPDVCDELSPFAQR
jgi:hypothetical protein